METHTHTQAKLSLHISCGEESLQVLWGPARDRARSNLGRALEESTESTEVWAIVLAQGSLGFW